MDVQQREIVARQSAEWFRAMLTATPVEIGATGMLVGPAHANHRAASEKMAGTGFRGYGDNRHFPMAVGNLLALGFAGIAAQAQANATSVDGERATYLHAIADCHEAAAAFAERHAIEARQLAGQAHDEDHLRLTAIGDSCRALAVGPPRSLAEAVQLFWFAYVMRNGPGPSTIGRLDQHLQPFYDTDLAAGRLTRDGALGILCELWELLNRVASADTLMNLMLAGQDVDGNDATCEMSHLMIEADCLVHKTEPHVNVRIHAGSPESIKDRLIELQLKGDGKGTVFNDEVLIPTLTAAGVDLDLARCYCNDGCDEVLFDSQSTIDFTLVEAVKSLELAMFNGRENTPPVDEPRANYYLADPNPVAVRTEMELGFASGDMMEMTRIDDVVDAFVAQYHHQVAVRLARFCQTRQHDRRHGVTSPFLGGSFPTCLAGGEDLLRGGVRRRVYMIFSGSLPTVADGLAAIGKVVFDDRACTIGELLTAIQADWVGFEPLRLRCLAAPKFGNDDDYVDAIATDIAERYCRFVSAYDGQLDFPIYPALFSNVFNQWSRIAAATPDGRRWGDPICAHWSATPGRARRGPTACIRSLAKAPFALAPGTAVTQFAVGRDCIPQNDVGRRLFRSLLDAALSIGISVINPSVMDVAALKAAQKHPEQHADLMVRVWGFSARFVTLDERMQNHIIARAVVGLEA